MLTLITLGRGANRLIRWLLSLSLFPFLFPFVSPHLSENADLSFPLPICYARYSKGEEQLRGALRKRSICSSRSPFSSPFAFSSLEINLRLVLFFFFFQFLPLWTWFIDVALARDHKLYNRDAIWIYKFAAGMTLFTQIERRTDERRFSFFLFFSFLCVYFKTSQIK